MLFSNFLATTYILIFVTSHPWKWSFSTTVLPVLHFLLPAGDTCTSITERDTENVPVHCVFLSFSSHVLSVCARSSSGLKIQQETWSLSLTLSSPPRLVSVFYFYGLTRSFRAEAAAADIHMADREHTLVRRSCCILLPISAHTHTPSVLPRWIMQSAALLGSLEVRGGSDSLLSQKIHVTAVLLFHWQEGKFHCHFSVERVSGTFCAWNRFRPRPIVSEMDVEKSFWFQWGLIGIISSFKCNESIHPLYLKPGVVYSSVP